MGSFDDIWEKEVYGRGHHLNKYPYDNTVSFIYRNSPRDRNRSEVRILEMGCGAGNNLWFAAREGFDVTGIDGSASAITHCQERFQKEGLAGKFIVGDFVRLPFPPDNFDLVIDRCSMTCLSKADCRVALESVHRVLRNNGRFLFNVYSDFHSSHAAGRTLDDGLTVDITGGNLQGVGGISFYSKSDIKDIFRGKWKIQSIKHKHHEEVANALVEVHAEWEVIAEKC